MIAERIDCVRHLSNSLHSNSKLDSSEDSLAKSALNVLLQGTVNAPSDKRIRQVSFDGMAIV